jgi:hypothetical protein
LSKAFILPNKIAWTNVTTGHFDDTGHTVTLSNDTILIHYVLGFTKHYSTLATFKIINEQIVANVLETLEYETNVGFIKSHYKNKHPTLYIDICELYDNCKEEKGVFTPKKIFFHSTFESKFTETKFYPIPRGFTEMVEHWKKPPKMKDY